MAKQVVLAILDGWGVGRNEPISNPIFAAKLLNIQNIKNRYLVGSLQASGIAVGLPWGEVGNSEVGHLTIGAGTVLYQHYPRITIAVRKGDFRINPAFQDSFNHVKENNSWLNITGLLTTGTIHASFEHLEALIKTAKESGVDKISLHLFSDGKDSEPKSFLNIYEKLQEFITEGVVVSSISGRHFALDRDSHYDRTEKAYQAMTGLISKTDQEVVSKVESEYETVNNDQHLTPFIPKGETHSVTDNDSLIFIDFREDSIRQIAESFIKKDFDKFNTKKFNNLHITTMTEYRSDFQVPVAFPSEVVKLPLAKVLSDKGLKQLQVAETEKYAHVTYFFNGFKDESYPNQAKILINSNNVESHAQEPQMQAVAITDRVLEGLDGGIDFIVVNYANADIVAHTGNFQSTIEAVKTIDEQMARLVKKVEELGAVLIITSDHGNAEVVRDSITGKIDTSHDPSPVPIYIIGKDFTQPKSSEEADQKESEVVGILSDVAPTILAIMGIEKPAEMTGNNLLPALKS
ncbi:MAG: 2,3-bisphosphoglycerate-independent phosphoglycerate mutase [Candidatus Harrisonbacteria bacterium CG10_big_fil_rev_8_21_14_0_10_38_8]|uniref:2,3-bisphosphoglycerate-independent phosphoglycerate mutase n=1 Tax=Candidatus Harrisonbacteria bacterium CG10_big_fil_rev_8_21_14_0_10_38_8 TaxID=1974582 RepID=A0A2M6WKV8_9BACT|nr:MAG: 2,3-bisphosphoglycerate-independent phosphoglycerate mutase [Candidatus Harrisonbacteria bacterium CG10_big_fil_rev_8_21_14_0_10_38_8]